MMLLETCLVACEGSKIASGYIELGSSIGNGAEILS